MQKGSSTLFHVLAIAVLLILLLLATGRASQAAEAPVTVTGGWFRALPSSVPSGGYFVLRNNGAAAITLEEVESPACGVLMMHKSEQGRMEHVMSLEVTAGQTLAFAPGGYHLMCISATPDMKPGASVPVTFRFSGGQVFTTRFAVRSATGK